MKINTIECSKCQRHIRNTNYQRHFDVCNGPKITKYPWHEWKINENLYQHPDGYIGNMAQVKLYMINVKGKSNLIPYMEKIKSGEIDVWNKGLTKKEAPSLAKSDEERTAMSKRQLENPQGVHKMYLDGIPTKGRTVHQYTTKSNEIIRLDSTWEVRLAKSLDWYDILWERPEKMIVNDNGNSYTPDFYLPNYDIYLDPKFREHEGQNMRITLWKKRYQKRLIIIKEEHQLNWPDVLIMINSSG